MKGCNYNCIIQSIVPENMIDQLNYIYSTSKNAFKGSNRQWFHVFNREHCLTLQELLDFRKDGFIEIQNGQIALLMIKIIQKYIGMIPDKVVHGNLTFDKVWIINNNGFWPHNQKHDYEIVFVDYQGGPSDHQRMKEILLALNEKALLKEKEKILEIILVDQNQKLIDLLVELATNINLKVDNETQKLTGWQASEAVIQNKFKHFADKDVFKLHLPMNIFINQTKLDQSLNWQYLDKSRNFIIKQILCLGQENMVEFEKKVQTELPKHIGNDKYQKQEIISYLITNVNCNIKDFIDKSVTKFEQLFKFNITKSFKDMEAISIECCLNKIYDNYFQFNGDQESQIEIIRPILERELENTKNTIFDENQNKFTDEVVQLTKLLK